MKRKILFRTLALVVCLLCSMSAGADCYFSMPDVSAHPGEEVTIPVSLVLDEEDIASFQFIFACPESIEILGAEKTDRVVEGATFVANQATNNGLNKVLCYVINMTTGSNAANLTGKSGPVANITIHIPDDASGQFTLSLTNLQVLLVGQITANLDDVTATLTVASNVPEAYACYTPSNTTLTFYYDKLRYTREGTTYQLSTGNYSAGWDNIRASVTQVVFDPSFAEATPTNANYWFYGMYYLQSITGIEYLNTANMTDMNGMFAYCSSLTSLDVSHFDTANSTDMGGMFLGCSGLTELDVSRFNTAKVTNMYGMFQDCTGLTMLDLGGFNLLRVTSMQYMFYNCSNLVTIYVGGGWYQDANVTSADTQYMFYGCTSIVGGQGTAYSIQHVDGKYNCPDDPLSGYPGYMTEKCYAVYTPDNNTLTYYFDYQRSSRQGTKYDLVWYEQDQPWYFDGTCSSVKQVVFDSSFAEVRPTSTYAWFNGMRQLQSVTGLQYLNTEDVESMRNMFRNCSNLKTLDLSGFNTANVTDVRSMFYNCNQLTTIYAGDGWTTANVLYGNNMFYDCYSLVGGMGTTFNGYHVDAAYAHIDGGTANPGYFTEKAVFLRGDVNGDGQVKIGDVTALIN